MRRAYVLSPIERSLLIPRLPLVGHIAESCPSEERLCYNCHEPGHESAACPSPRNTSSNVAGKQCYGCGGIGHIASDCPSLPSAQKGFRGGGSAGAGAGQKCYVSFRRNLLY